jgi:hypothetical protein
MLWTEAKISQGVMSILDDDDVMKARYKRDGTNTKQSCGPVISHNVYFSTFVAGMKTNVFFGSVYPFNSFYYYWSIN